jgi:NitT/TauT family transport system permease protein
VLGRVEVLRRIFIPLLHLANTLPRIALAPLFIFWFGIGEPSKVILVVTIVLFIMIFNVYSGVLTVSRDYLLTAKLLGKSEWQIAREVIIPWCVPWIFVGLRLGLAWSLSGAVVGEFIAARLGIGYLILNSASNLDNAGVLAGCVVLLALATVFFVVVSAAEKRMSKWRPEGL